MARPRGAGRMALALCATAAVLALALCAQPVAAAEAPTSPVPRDAGLGVTEQVWDKVMRLLPNPLKVGSSVAARAAGGRVCGLRKPALRAASCESAPVALRRPTPR